MRGIITNIAGWRDTEFIIHAAAGRFNCSWTNSSGRLWTFPEGTVLHSDGTTPISSSTAEKPDVDIPTGGGVVKLKCKGWGGNYIFSDNDTNANILLDLSDLPALTYYLSLGGCSSVTGDLSDLPALTYYLNLYGCSNITGDLSDLPALTNNLNLYNCTNITGDLSDLPALTDSLNLYGCSNITGDLSDLPALTNYLNLTNCSNITGAYTSVSGSSVPTSTYLDYTGISSADMDSTLIAYAATSKNGGTFRANGMSRTTASDTAVSTLTDPARGWTITGLTVV